MTELNSAQIAYVKTAENRAFSRFSFSTFINDIQNKLKLRLQLGSQVNSSRIYGLNLNVFKINL